MERLLGPLGSPCQVKGPRGHWPRVLPFCFPLWLPPSPLLPCLLSCPPHATRLQNFCFPVLQTFSAPTVPSAHADLSCLPHAPYHSSLANSLMDFFVKKYLPYYLSIRVELRYSEVETSYGFGSVNFYACICPQDHFPESGIGRGQLPPKVPLCPSRLLSPQIHFVVFELHIGDITQ